MKQVVMSSITASTVSRSRRSAVNKAEAIDLERGLSLKRSQAAAIIQYRNQHGAFKSVEDLKKAPGVDV
jgi:competence protein ComEA